MTLWAGVLDDLELRLVAAEAGELDALGGWERPAAVLTPMTAAEQVRASGIVARQQALMASLRERQAAVLRASAALRRPKQFRVAAPLPVYVDRTA